MLRAGKDDRPQRSGRRSPQALITVDKNMVLSKRRIKLPYRIFADEIRANPRNLLQLKDELRFLPRRGRFGFDGGAGSWNACRGFWLLVKPLVNSLTANSDYALAA